jgi:ATP-binding cassette, subfamily B, bacterial HlyB/CyaB
MNPELRATSPSSPVNSDPKRDGSGGEVAALLYRSLTALARTVDPASHVAPEAIAPYLKAIELSNFRLGDAIAVFSHTSESAEDSSSASLYIVLQGRVRLLCQSSAEAREVTVQRLEAEELFGADDCGWVADLDYRAIAASPVQIARMPQSVYQALVETHPALGQALKQLADQRSQLIFWRTMTQLRSLPSQQLQLLLPYLTIQTVAAETAIATTAPSSAGRFWLRQGVIQRWRDQPDPEHPEPAPPQLGEGWGYPDPVDDRTADWVAQTPLVLYHLPRQAWQEVATLLPKLAALLQGQAVDPNLPTPRLSSVGSVGSAGSVGSVGQSQMPLVQTQIPLAGDSPRSRSGRADGERTRRSNGRVVHLKSEAIAAPTEESPAIDFPKPVKRHLMDWLGRYPWIEQQSSSDCGAACLAMICRYWGKTLPIHWLRDRANVNRGGASLKSLAKAAEEIGFQSRPVRASLGKLAELNHPWIAHWEGSHYVVVYQIKGDRVIIADPAVGRRAISRKRFQEHWTGYALLLDPTERFQDVDVQQASLGRYLSALTPYRNIALQVILLSLLVQVFGLVTPLFTQLILDKIVVEKSLPTLNIFALGLLIFGIWSIGITSIRRYLLCYLSNRLDLTLISGFIRHTLKLPLKFFETRRVGDIITRVQENEKIQRFLVQQVVVAWLDFLTGFIYLGLMLYYNWQLTILVLALIPPIILFTLAATPLLRQVSRDIFKEVSDQNSTLVEMMTGVATVKAAAAENDMRWRWEDHLTSQVNAVFRGQKLGIRLEAISGLINIIGSTALLWYGANLVIKGELTIGQLVAFNMMLGYVITPIIALANVWDELQEVLISVERLNDIFEAKPEEAPQKLALVMPALRGSVTLEQVSFQYDSEGDSPVLQNISFEAQPGETIAIVGRSGSGKSTLINLLQGLYHPTKGRVIIDGHDLRHVSLSSLRSQLGVVPQESFLFSGTILDNISLYRSDYPLEAVVEVAKLAEAHAFIQSFPLGYNTKVGERGTALSGGQRQRIAIARALLGQPRILVLDEATSSLDSESERRFQRNLTQITRDRTTFIIAHRFSTVRNADRILVLDRGTIVEQGTHDQLIAQAGLYHHLAQQQLEL